MIAFMVVKNKKSIYTLYARFYILIEMFYLIYTQLIICLTVIINSNLLIAGDCRVFVLEKKMIFYFNHNERQNCLILRIRSLNDKNPFSIARLN